MKEIEQRQDDLLGKIECLYNQLIRYQKQQAMLNMKPIQEEFVLHLSAEQPSDKMVKFIEQFREKLSIRTFCHSSLRNPTFKSPLIDSPSSTNRKLTVIWSAEENLPSMFHAQMQINDEQAMINLISHQLTNAA